MSHDEAESNRPHAAQTCDSSVNRRWSGASTSRACVGVDHLVGRFDLGGARETRSTSTMIVWS
jgi:hypothetical protein